MEKELEIYKARCLELMEDETLEIFEHEGVTLKTNVQDMEESVKIKYIESFKTKELPNTLSNIFVIDEQKEDYSIYFDTKELAFKDLCNK